LVPRIIGDSINLHPIVVICAVAVGLSVGGILGALLAPPIVATFRVIGSYIHAKLLDYPPFAGRPLTSNVPKQYRRKVTGKDLVAQEEGQSASTAAVTTSAPAVAAGTGSNVLPAANGTQATPSSIPTEAQG
jgi:hypothetical protein